MSKRPDRIAAAFAKAAERGPGQKLLSVFLTAGFPRIDDTLPICKALETAGVDMLEIGFPFSDPLADGPTIQSSSSIALRNGMSLKTLFAQLEALRPTLDIPVLLMGYLNPILQFGVEAFCQRCAEVGVDGLILPDLPLEEYVSHYQALFAQHQLKTVWLVTPRTPDDRIRVIDDLTTGFVYVVSSHAVTGDQLDVDQQKAAYFERIAALKLKHPLMVGFGIHDRESFERSTTHAHGGIIGSAFLKALQRADFRQIDKTIETFVRKIRPVEGAEETQP